MKTVITAAILIVTTTAFADSLDEKQFWKRQRDYVDRQLELANKACGAKFNFDWEDRPTLREETAKTKHMPHSVCTNVLDTVAAICRSGADEKATVAAKINTITCGFAADRSLDLRGGKLRYMGNNVQPNFSAWAKPWLLKHL